MNRRSSDSSSGGIEISTAFKAIFLVMALIFPGMLITKDKGFQDIVPKEEYGLPSAQGFFTENLGQWDDRISFVAEASFGRIGLGPEGVYLDIIDQDYGMIPVTFDEGQMFLPEHDVYAGRRSGHVILCKFKDGYAPEPKGIDPLPHMTNYFLGNDPNRWVTHANSYREVIYHDVWDGIDIRYHFSTEGLKYDIILEPRASVQDVRIDVLGHDKLDLDKHGSLMIHFAEGVVMDRDLDVFYLDDPDDKIPSEFVLITEDTYGFAIPNRQRDRRVVIDPIVSSTFFGGSGKEWGYSVAKDPNGGVVLAGSTSSQDFPTSTGAYSTSYGGGYDDYFVSKFDDDLSNLIFSTYIGGSGSEGSQGYYGCTIDVMEDGILLAGITGSSDFPTTTDCYQDSLKGYYDAVFLKLDSNGTSLLFSSYLGGSGSYDRAKGISASSDGGFFVWGFTGSNDYPTTSGVLMESMSGSNDGFITKFQSSGNTIAFSTYIGGSGNFDYVEDLKELSNGDILIAGYTYSSNFPTTEGAYSRTLKGSSDGYLTRLKSDASAVLSSTLYGGSSTDRAYSLTVRDNGNIVVAGDTYSNDYPLSDNAFRTTFAGYYEGFVTELLANMSDIVASTFVGGSSMDYAVCVDTDPTGMVIVAGYSSSSDLLTTEDAFQKTSAGGKDMFITILEDGFKNQTYCSFMGGSGNDTLTGMFVDPNGRALFTGHTTSANFPVLNESYQNTLKGSSDAVLFSMDLVPWLEPLMVHHIKVYGSPDFFEERELFDIGEKAYVELYGLDANTSMISGARVNITYRSGAVARRQVTLLETGKDSGVFRGALPIPENAIYFDVVDIVSWKDPSISASIVIDYPFRPIDVSSVSISNDESFEYDIDKMDLGERVWIKVEGLDSNPITVDRSFVNITSDGITVFNHPVVLTETGPSSGEYICFLDIPLTMDYFENVTIRSIESPEVEAKFMIHTPIQLRPLQDVTEAIEHEEYRVRYWNFGYETETWEISFNEYGWLEWDEDEKVLHGIPNNNHIDEWFVIIHIWDDRGHSDVHEFQIEVINTPPRILTENVLVAYEGLEYVVDYDSSDDGQGSITWSVYPSDSWLSMDKDTGILSGTPKSRDVGIMSVVVTVNDGKGGINSTSFLLNVMSVNKPPFITTSPLRSIKQGEQYYRRFEATDPDGDTDLSWELYTDARFLTMDDVTGELSGTPGQNDVGSWSVNVTVRDPGNLTGSRVFDLTVEDVNDRPVWTDVPSNAEVVHGTVFRSNVRAMDPDPDDVMEYSLWTSPESNMTINSRNGLIEWRADYRVFEGEGDELEVNLRASDGILHITHVFLLKIIPTGSPRSTLLAPAQGIRTSFKMTRLEWKGVDPENDALTYTIYLHEDRDLVEGRRADAIHSDDHSGEVLNVTGLEQGKTYYWTVIPFDRCTYGTCEHGVSSFKVNNAPTIERIRDQKAEVKKSYHYTMAGEDADTEDDELVFTLKDGPAGMEVSEEDGSITWTPYAHQLGDHTVRVSISDGIDETEMSFRITVIEGDSILGSPLMIAGMVVLGIMLLAVIVLQIMILTRKRRVSTGEDMIRGTKEIITEAADHLERIESKAVEGERSEPVVAEGKLSASKPIEDEIKTDPKTSVEKE
ncbi:MAG: putative Ig domain-containing protein [Candidatus Thermoplasmatota archaeon]|nr:putative Ig domain-containing protein [Candidatus Thermoplasmatota archaeon]